MKKRYYSPSVLVHQDIQFETGMSGASGEMIWVDPTHDDYYKKTSTGFTVVDPTNDDYFARR